MIVNLINLLNIDFVAWFFALICKCVKMICLEFSLSCSLKKLTAKLALYLNYQICLCWMFGSSFWLNFQTLYSIQWTMNVCFFQSNIACFLLWNMSKIYEQEDCTLNSTIMNFTEDFYWLIAFKCFNCSSLSARMTSHRYKYSRFFCHLSFIIYD